MKAKKPSNMNVATISDPPRGGNFTPRGLLFRLPGVDLSIPSAPLSPSRLRLSAPPGPSAHVKRPRVLRRPLDWPRLLRCRLPLPLSVRQAVCVWRHGGARRPKGCLRALRQRGEREGGGEHVEHVGDAVLSKRERERRGWKEWRVRAVAGFGMVEAGIEEV